MAKQLERDLGLFAVVAISVGAMIGSGIFILPALAIPITGPSVILAYLLAGLIVLPAALSKSEMATAMPQSGGTYLYIDRAMGPMMGTVAGGGTWFALTFKSALALVGGAPYIALLLDISPMILALGIGAFLVLVNIVGVKQTGWLQTVIVTVMVIALIGFIYSGMGWVEADAYHPFITHQTGGLLAATGLVFVSYAGVTKIASVAEEIEDPGRNVPLGMLASLGFTTLLYVLIVYVMVGVTDAGTIAGSATPMAVAADAFMGQTGVVIIVLAAILALVSTANAGILSASRYPLAMARDALVPGSLSEISERFRTPIGAITLTGLLMLFLVAFVPILQIAKLASAFQILVFILVNIALIAFREGAVESYEPSFRSPLYPWMQLFGIGGGVVLLTQMGALPAIGAVVIVAGCLAWFQFYAKGRTVREGVAVDALRRSDADRRVARTREAMEDIAGFRVLVPVGPTTPEGREPALLGVAADIVRQEGGEVRMIRFEEVPDQISLRDAVEIETPEGQRFEQRHDHAGEELEVPVQVGSVVSHDTPRALTNYVDRAKVDLVVATAMDRGRHLRPFRRDLVETIRELPCDVVLVSGGDQLGEIGEVAVVADRRPFDPLKVRIANAIAVRVGATIRFLHAVDLNATDAHLTSLRAYHEELGELCSVPTQSTILREMDRVAGMVDAARTADLVVTAGEESSRSGHDPTWQASQRLANEATGPVLYVFPEERRKTTLLTRIAERLLYTREPGGSDQAAEQDLPVEEDTTLAGPGAEAGEGPPGSDVEEDR